MSFLEAQARLQAAVFLRLGNDATWTGAADPVRVRWREADEDLRLDRGTLVVTGRLIKVRRSEIANPAAGDEVQILDDDGNPISGAAFVVTGEPMLDRKGVWTCQVLEA